MIVWYCLYRWEIILSQPQFPVSKSRIRVRGDTSAEVWAGRLVWRQHMWEMKIIQIGTNSKHITKIFLLNWTVNHNSGQDFLNFQLKQMIRAAICQFVLMRAILLFSLCVDCLLKWNTMNECWIHTINIPSPLLLTINTLMINQIQLIQISIDHTSIVNIVTHISQQSGVHTQQVKIAWYNDTGSL